VAGFANQPLPGGPVWTLGATDQAKGGEVGELVAKSQIAQRRFVCEEGSKRDASTGSVSAAE
jgi:hypothetical protein